MPFASSISSDLCFSPVYMWCMSICPSCDDVDRNPCAGLWSVPCVDHGLFSSTLLGAVGGVGGWVGVLSCVLIVLLVLVFLIVLSSRVSFRLLLVVVSGGVVSLCVSV